MLLKIMQMLLIERGTGETNLISIALQYLKQIPCLIIKINWRIYRSIDETKVWDVLLFLRTKSLIHLFKKQQNL